MTTRIVLRSAIAAAALAAAFGATAATPAAKEAAAAKAPSQLSSASESQYMTNAQSRCTPLPEGFKQACLDRVNGAGSRTGSVEGGGILRESSTTSTLGTQMMLPAAHHMDDGHAHSAHDL